MIQLTASFGVVGIGDEARRMFTSYAQMKPTDSEAGGVLLGRLINGSSDIVIDSLTTPNAEDRRSRFSFHRARRSTQSAVNEAWRRSNGTTIYLGEWHTHPEDEPTPSPQDLRDRQRILAETRCEQDYLLFVIVGRTVIRIWDGCRSSGASSLIGDVEVEATDL